MHQLWDADIDAVEALTKVAGFDVSAWPGFQERNALHETLDRLTKSGTEVSDTTAVSILKLLIDSGVDVNQRDDRDGETPLHLAAHDFEAGIELLLNAGANPNLENYHGLTPLFRMAPKFMVYRGSDPLTDAERQNDAWHLLDRMLEAGGDPHGHATAKPADTVQELSGTNSKTPRRQIRTVKLTSN